jgi:hypothetical protein
VGLSDRDSPSLSVGRRALSHVDRTLIISCVGRRRCIARNERNIRLPPVAAAIGTALLSPCVGKHLLGRGAGRWRLDVQLTRDGAPPVELIDGDRLCDLLKEFRLGVDVRERIAEDVTVNPGFFDEYQ